MPLVLCKSRSPIQLVSKSTKLLSSLAKLNDKATNAKLESATYLANKLNNVTNKVTQTKLAMQENYF